MAWDTSQYTGESLFVYAGEDTCEQQTKNLGEWVKWLCNFYPHRKSQQHIDNCETVAMKRVNGEPRIETQTPTHE